MTPSEMQSRCTVEIDRLIADVDTNRNQSSFIDIGATAEVLALCGGIESTRPLRERLSDASLRWLRDGLFDDAAFSRVEYLYHTALLCYFATRAAGFHPSDAEHSGRLLSRGLVGRNELPALTMQLVARYMDLCGIDLGAAAPATRDLRLAIDKRVLRARSDEYDVLTLLMVAQACSLGASEQVPRIFPQTLLVQAIRGNHVNWIAVLTLLCTSAFGMPAWLRAGASDALASHLQNANELLPAPEAGYRETDYVQRAENGLRLRSSIAGFALLLN